MEFIVAIITMILGFIAGCLWSKSQTRGVLMKVLDNNEDAAAALYLALNCQPEDLKNGEIVKFQVKETHSQK